MGDIRSRLVSAETVAQVTFLGSYLDYDDVIFGTFTIILTAQGEISISNSYLAMVMRYQIF